MMLRVAICDDEKLHREHTARIVCEKLAPRQPETDCFDSAEAMLRTIDAGDYTPDIAVLDIQMGETDGIALA